MEFVLIVIVVALVIIKYLNGQFKAGSDDSWTPAKPSGQSMTGNGSPTPTPFNPAQEDYPAAKGNTGGPIPVEKNVTVNHSPVRHRPVAYERIFGLAGKPVSHSHSAEMFNEKFHREGIPAEYRNFEIDDASQVRYLAEANPKLCGLNITSPYKTDVLKYLDRTDGAASEIGAVNVVKIVRGEAGLELVGYNTDHIGFWQSLEPMLNGRSVKALVLGTGGASKAVCYALGKAGIEYKVVSRSSDFSIMGYYELSPSVMEEHQLIVNCTPVGMSPDTGASPDIPYAYLTGNHILYDLIYNPETTMFMEKGSSHGATVCNGAEMLRIQADESWKIWNE